MHFCSIFFLKTRIDIGIAVFSTTKFREKLCIPKFQGISLKGVKTLKLTLCFNYMAKEFLCSGNLLFICNNFSVLTMLGDGFTSFSLFSNELKQFED